MWDAIAQAAAAESELWASCLRPSGQRVREPVFSRLAPDVHALGLETIYEGYLVHYGRSRLFSAPDADTGLLLGDYLYAQGLVRIAESGDVGAVADLAELISLCTQVRAEGRDGDGAAWAATASLLGSGGLGGGRDRMRLDGDSTALESAARRAAGDAIVDETLAAHTRLVG